MAPTELPNETLDRFEKLIVVLGRRTTTQNELLEVQNTILQDIALSLQQIARASNPFPNLQHRLAEFSTYDWEALGVEILSTDQDGPAKVSWQGQLFTRRSGTGKFGDAIWFSCARGKDAEGKMTYGRLITFKTFAEAEAIPAKTKALVT